MATITSLRTCAAGFAAVAILLCFSTAASADTCSGFLTGLISETVTQSPENNSDLSCSLLSQQAVNADMFTFDYGVPHSPALMLAGLSTDKITPANSLKPFVLALPDLLSSDSSTSSAALDFSPAWAFGDRTRNTINYLNDAWFDRVWLRSRVSVALSKGDSGGSDSTQAQPSRAAFGLSLSLVNGSDPVWARTDADGDTSHWLRCLDDKKSQWGPYTPAQTTGWLTIGHASSKITDIEVQALQLQKNQRPTVTIDDEHYVAIEDAAKLVNEDVSWLKTADWKDAASLEKLRGLAKIFGTKLADIKSGADYTAAHDARVAVITACQKESSDLAQHGADLQIGAGVVLQGSPGTLSNLTDPSGAVWVAGRLPFTDIFGESKPDRAHPTATGLCDPASGERSELACWTIGGSGRYSAGEMDATGDTTTPMFKANVAEGWIGIERTSSTMKLGGYFGYMDQSAVNVADKAFSRSGTRWLFSGAYSLSSWVNGLWVVGSYGNANGSTTTLNDKVALLSLTFGPPDLSSTFKESPPPAPAASNPPPPPAAH